VASARFWDGLAETIATLAPRHREVLAGRDQLQQSIDDWHRHRQGGPPDPAAYRAFLEAIGYIVPVGEAFEIETAHVDLVFRGVSQPSGYTEPILHAHRIAQKAATAGVESVAQAE
jgi:malate synthase